MIELLTIYGFDKVAICIDFIFNFLFQSQHVVNKLYQPLRILFCYSSGETLNFIEIVAM